MDLLQISAGIFLEFPNSIGKYLGIVIRSPAIAAATSAYHVHPSLNGASAVAGLHFL